MYYIFIDNGFQCRLSSGKGPTQWCPLDECYEGCCLTTGLCASPSCATSVGKPKDSKAQCDALCQEKTNCILWEDDCTGPHCMGIVECVDGPNDCAGRNGGNICIYSGEMSTYQICDADDEGFTRISATYNDLF